jgi:hypothetical protein
MEKHFVTYNQAVALKELGFDMPCIATYTEGTIGKGEELQWFVTPQEDVNNDFTFVAAPLKSQVFEWARKEHVLYHIVHQFEHKKNTTEEFLSEVTGKLLMGNDDISGFSYHSTYKEAELACIDILIEIVKSNKQ